MTSTSIAKTFLEENLNIRASSFIPRQWLEFKDHRWVNVSDMSIMQKVFINESDLSYQLKEKIMYEIAVMAFDGDFMSNLDKNKKLICFTNGVYDLSCGTFRNGKMDDYISLCVNYPYLQTYDKNCLLSKEIDNFFEKVMPDEKMRNYLMKILSSCLDGNVNESIYAFVGNNGLIIIDMLMDCLGDLGRKINEKNIMDELIKTKGVRACFINQAEIAMDLGFMKILTGGDVLTNNDLPYPIYFTPVFKLFIKCDDLSVIKTNDKGIQRRLSIIPFSSVSLKVETDWRQLLMCKLIDGYNMI